jgi:hypothetical protein
MSRLTDADLLPDDIEPFADDSWKADAHRDLCIPEDREKWRQVGIDFKVRWEHLFIQPGALTKRQAE